MYPPSQSALVLGARLRRHPVITSKDARRMDEFMHYGVLPASRPSVIPESISARSMRSAAARSAAPASAARTIEQEYANYLKGGPRKISPFFIPASIVNMIGGHLSIKYG